MERRLWFCSESVCCYSCFDFAFGYSAFVDFNLRSFAAGGTRGFCQSWRTRLVVMMAEFEIPGRQVDVHYVNAGVPCTVEENFEGYLEHGDLSFEELLQAQEFLYQSFQSNSENNAAEASTSSHTDTSAYGQQRDTETRNIEKEEESSEPNQIAAQLASDEALARTMQEMENQFSETSISGTARKESESPLPSTINREPSSTDTTTVARQDDIDPDNMSYEELQSLGESIGTENRGLSDEVISYLPSFKYKTGGLFSKKDKHEECVICCMAYKNRDVVMSLPCLHQYHSNCISRWLKLNKACPVCNEEVFGS